MAGSLWLFGLEGKVSIGTEPQSPDPEGPFSEQKCSDLEGPGWIASKDGLCFLGMEVVESDIEDLLIPLGPACGESGLDWDPEDKLNWLTFELELVTIMGCLDSDIEVVCCVSNSTTALGTTGWSLEDVKVADAAMDTADVVGT